MSRLCAGLRRGMLGAALLALAHVSLLVPAIHRHFHDLTGAECHQARELASATGHVGESRAHASGSLESDCPICVFLAHFAASAPEVPASVSAPPRSGDAGIVRSEAVPRFLPAGHACPRAPPVHIAC